MIYMVSLKLCSKLNRDVWTSLLVLLFVCDGLIYLGQEMLLFLFVNVYEEK